MLAYKFINSENFIVGDKENMILFPYYSKIYSKEGIETFLGYKIGSKLKQQKYSNFIVYKLEKIK